MAFTKPNQNKTNQIWLSTTGRSKPKMNQFSLSKSKLNQK